MSVQTNFMNVQYFPRNANLLEGPSLRHIHSWTARPCTDFPQYVLSLLYGNSNNQFNRTILLKQILDWDLFPTILIFIYICSFRPH